MIQIADTLWIVERPQRFYGVEVGTRTTLVRLGDGGLFVHSPVALDPALRAAVEALGPVRAIVAASAFHHLYVPDWAAAWPDALVCACPRLTTKRPDVAWTRVLGDAPEPEWAGELDQVHFAARTLEDEVVFFHRNSRTFICADAVFHLYEHPLATTRAVAALLGNLRPGATWLERFLIRDRVGARSQVARMVGWEPERLVLAHGPILDAGAARVLRDAYAWL